MASFPMALSNPWPGFKGHDDTFQRWISQKRAI